MSGPIANQWTGNGLPDGTPITTDNVNAAGNGVATTFSGGSTAGGTMVTEGNGFRYAGEQTSSIRRIDFPIAGDAVIAQARITVDALALNSNATAPIVFRNATAVAAFFNVFATGRVGIGGLANTTTSPAVALGDRLDCDVVAALHPTPTASNGRVFFRVKNLSNPTWNETGEFFYDSGYTMDLGTAPFAAIRFGKQTSEVLPQPGMLIEFPGYQVTTVNPAHLSEAQAKTYFADTPVYTGPVVPSSGPVRPIAGAGSGSTGWSILGGAASEGAALNDTGATRLLTGIISPEIAAGATSERIFQLAPLTPFTSGQTFEIDILGDTISTPAPTVRLRFYNGSTIVATKTVVLPQGLADGSAPTTPETVVLTATETAALNPLAIRIGIQAAR